MVGALHGVYHHAIDPSSHLETHIGDAMIGYITECPSICEPKPQREVPAITPIDFMAEILEFRKLLPHLPPMYLSNVIWAQRVHVLSRAEQVSRLQASRLSSTGVRHQPRRSPMEGRTDPDRARQVGIEHIASWWHAMRLHVPLVVYARGDT